MALLDRWLKRFLSSDARVEPQATDSRQPPVDVSVEVPDAHADHVRKVRARLTLDANGRQYAQSAAFLVELRSLDAAARGKVADALLADALLVSPSRDLRQQLAERYLFRGDRDRAETLLATLAADPDANAKHAVFALTQLGEMAEARGDDEAALAFYERVLAIDMSLLQQKTRARRLRARSDERNFDGQKALARLLGANAVGERYDVVAEIGRGGAATVFRAKDKRLLRDVALKVFHAKGKPEDRRARLRAEARIAGRFDHPHIVPLFDVNEDRDYLVMAHCEGGSLEQCIARRQLTMSDALEWGAVLLRTLSDIHDAGCLHLDVKPSNLLFADGRLLLGDFGTAGMRQLDTAAGTRAYMAPEQLSLGAVDPRTDVYAAGLVVRECVAAIGPPADANGPRWRAVQRCLTRFTAASPAARPGSGREAAVQLLEAAAMPERHADGHVLHNRLVELARRAACPETRVREHPWVKALRAPEAESN